MKLLLTISDVVEMVSLSRATIYRRMNEKKFPSTIKVSDQAVRWRRSDIEEWAANPESWTPTPAPTDQTPADVQ